MAKIMVQFHALPSEIVDFVKVYTKEYQLETVLMQLSPGLKVIAVTKYEFDQNISKLEKLEKIFLCTSKPNCNVKSLQEFMNKNQDSLVFSIGKYDNDSLGESFVAAKTDDSSIIRIWRQIVKNLKLNIITKKGAWVVNPYTGNKEFYPEHLYSNAANRVFKEGIKILPAVGWNYFVLNEEIS